ncbi:transposase [Roseobacter sp. YSTF-M11]|uniref:Transposase n=1 Tax=Roseobacter insulae TaxID=2859783 RepID=A0A9X1JY68_9RHOB|nr:transposase [Roseobacter insulae]MBW4707865.1 transposase [Roseobacter insulae]
MSDTTHSEFSGATYFFTARLADQRSSLLVEEVVLLRQAMRETIRRYPFEIDAIVVLPAAVHTIWTLPRGDTDFATRWRFLKTRFAHALLQNVPQRAEQLAPRGQGIWQRRFWDHRIRSAHDLAVHRSLIHSAPVQSGLVQDAKDWAWTSLHRDHAAAHARVNRSAPPKFSEMALKTKKTKASVA